MSSADDVGALFQVIENFFERMGSTVSAGEESSERDPSPDYYGGSKKKPLGDDPHPVSIGEKKKGFPDDPVDEKKNRLATSQLVSRLLRKHKFHKL